MPKKMCSYTKIKASLRNDPLSSDWLRNAIAELDQRDPVDAASDIETLQQLCSVRLRSQGILMTRHQPLEEDTEMRTGVTIDGQARCVATL